MDPRLYHGAHEDLNLAHLCYAASNGDLSLIRLLVSTGAEVNGADYDGRTPLHMAAVEGQTKAVSFLLHLGAKPEAKDNYGNTPLDEAKKNNREECARVLERTLRNKNKATK